MSRSPRFHIMGVESVAKIVMIQIIIRILTFWFELEGLRKLIDTWIVGQRSWLALSRIFDPNLEIIENFMWSTFDNDKWTARVARMVIVKIKSMKLHIEFQVSKASPSHIIDRKISVKMCFIFSLATFLCPFLRCFDPFLMRGFYRKWHLSNFFGFSFANSFD